jgi:hypothetical protein
LFFDLPAIEVEQQRIVEEGQSSLEMLKIIGEQAGEMQKELESRIALMPKEEVLKEYCALWASAEATNRRLRDLDAQGYALFLKGDVEAKDKRIAKLEQEIRALKAKEKLK